MGLETKDVVIAAVGAFISWALLTHLLPGLRWIPYAFVAGVLATILGVLYVIITTSRGTYYGSTTPSPIPAPAFIRPSAWDRERAALKERAHYRKKTLLPQSKTVSKNFDGLLDLILRDFITSWYNNISKRPLFQNEVDRAIRDTARNVRDRLASLDIVEIGVSRIVPIVTTHMRDFYDAERAVRGKNLTRNITESEELDLAIAGKYRDGRLHPAADLTFSDCKLMQQAHLRKTIAKFLPIVLPDSMKTSPAVTALIREIVACAVLAPIMQMLADPDMWNQILEGYVSLGPGFLGLCYADNMFRDALCFKIGRRFGNLGQRSMNMRPLPLNRRGRRSFLASDPTTMRDSSNALSEPSDSVQHCQMRAASEARLLVRSEEETRPTSRTLYTCVALKLASEYWTRRLLTSPLEAPRSLNQS